MPLAQARACMLVLHMPKEPYTSWVLQAAHERTEARERELYGANKRHWTLYFCVHAHEQAAHERTEAAEARGRELYEAHQRP